MEALNTILFMQIRGIITFGQDGGRGISTSFINVIVFFLQLYSHYSIQPRNDGMGGWSGLILLFLTFRAVFILKVAAIKWKLLSRNTSILCVDFDIRTIYSWTLLQWIRNSNNPPIQVYSRDKFRGQLYKEGIPTNMRVLICLYLENKKYTLSIIRSAQKLCRRFYTEAWHRVVK